MDVDKLSKYAILLCNSKVTLYQSSDTQIRDNGVADALESANNCNEITVNAGTLIQIFNTKNCTRGSKNLIQIQILDFDNRIPMYENLYECPLANLRCVNEQLWPLVISIVDPEQRIRLIKDTNHCKWLLTLHLNNIVSVSGEMFGKPGTKYDCIIRYIGPVEQQNSVGYFFGLELLNLINGKSPQADKIPFCRDYFESAPELSIITTSNWISPIPKEEQKIFSAAGLLNDTIDKVKSAIAPISSVTGFGASNATSFNNKDKKNKKTKAPTSTFYTFPDKPDISTHNNNNNNNNNNNKMERDKTGLLNTMESREKNLERRGTTTTTSTAQTQTKPQSGILKNKNKDQMKSLGNGPEIVVIKDKLTHEESNVIVIEKPLQQSVELYELLGGKWPHNAGDAAAILNKQKTGINANKTNRNKSSNPLTHLAGNNAKKSNDTNPSNKKNNDNRQFQDAAYELPSFIPTSTVDSDLMQNVSLSEVPDADLGLGSLVEVDVPDLTGHLYGVIRWIGIPHGEKNLKIGVELDEDCIEKPFTKTDGGYNGVSLFKCPAGRGFFVTPDRCSIDRRFLGAEGGAVGNISCEINDNKIKATNGFHDDQQTFGNMECPIVPGAVAPIECSSLIGLENLCGQFKGIQGHHNSCYLDVTLFSMFAFTPVFDAILYRPPEKDDISEYAEVQKVLREEIVNPLRKQMFVRADRVMKLRELLDKLSSVSGLCSEEKDPEEFLNCLLSQIMRAEPFLKLNSGQDAYYYQLFVDKDERLSFPSVQQLFEQSFYSSNIKLKEVPSCLIIQMPRFGKSFKMYPRILPSQVLDVTDIIDDSPRQCTVCGKLAEYECRDCYGILQNGVGLESTSFCRTCIGTVHMHAKRINHSYRELSVFQDYRVMADHTTVPRLYMELFAVLCIETSHYVTFVKAGSGPDAPWCFFDSMADRKGELNGYNIPEMKTVPDLPQWLSEDGARTVNETSSNDKMLPEHAKRLFCDAYMCMYQSTDVMMYR